MKYAVKMSLDDMTYTPSFIHIGSATQKLFGGIRRWQDDLISLLLHFHSKEKTKINVCKDIAHTSPYMTDVDYATLEKKSIVVGTSLLIAGTE
jgi:hypothetical protein